LSEFDFEIEPVSNSKIKHVDALSMHVGLFEETKLMSKEFMLKEERKDSFSKEQTQNRLTANGQYFWTWMEFCVGARGKQPKLVVPQSDTRRNRRKSRLYFRGPSGKRGHSS